MSVYESFLQILNEKATIDWNNYLTKDEVKQFLSKDDKMESAENIIYSEDFKKRYQDLHNSLETKYNNSRTKNELVNDLVNFYENGHLITETNKVHKTSFDLWKSQMDNKSIEELNNVLNHLYDTILQYSKNDTKDIKSNKMFDLTKKIDFLEKKLGVSKKLGRELK